MEGAFLVANIREFRPFEQTAGNGPASRLDARFAKLMQEETEALSGRSATSRAGGVTVLFDSTGDAVRAALELQRRFEREKEAVPVRSLDVAIGLAAGTYAEAGEAYVGTPLKLAERLCALAVPGEILTSDPLCDSGDVLSAARLVERGAVQLNGFPDPITVFQVLSPSEEMGKV